MALETVERTDEARKIYGKLIAISWSPSIRRNALALVQGLDIAARISKQLPGTQKPALDMAGLYLISEGNSTLNPFPITISPYWRIPATHIAFHISFHTHHRTHTYIHTLTHLHTPISLSPPPPPPCYPLTVGLGLRPGLTNEWDNYKKDDWGAKPWVDDGANDKSKVISITSVKEVPITRLPYSVDILYQLSIDLIISRGKYHDTLSIYLLHTPY